MSSKILFLFVFVAIFMATASFVLADQVVLTNPLGTVNTIPDLLVKIARGVAALVAALSTIMIIIAGIIYLTSAGNTQQIEKGKKAFQYAVVGIIIALSAEAIIATIKAILGS